MKSKIEAWLAQFSITTHTVAIVFMFLFAAYFNVPQFHDLVFHLYGLLPQWAKDLTATAIALYMWYRKGQPQTTK